MAYFEAQSYIQATGTALPWWARSGGTVRTLDSDADIAVWQRECGLDWHVVQMPVIVNNVAVKDWQANVRSDTGAVLDIVSSGWKDHQNDEIIGAMRRFVSTGEMTLDTMGSFFGGKIIWALARLGESVTVKTERGEDRHLGYFLLSTGHKAGYASQADLTDIRVVCMNTITAARTQQSNTRWRMTHRRAWDTMTPDEIQAMVTEAKARMNHVADEWRELYSAPLDPLAEVLAYTELLQPDLYKQTVEYCTSRETVSLGGISLGVSSRTPEQKRMITLDMLVSDSDARREVVQSILNPEEFNRPVTAVLEQSRNADQPGYALQSGTCASIPASISFWTDHERGHNAETAGPASLIGTGRTVKQSAMELGLVYASALAEASRSGA